MWCAVNTKLNGRNRSRRGQGFAELAIIFPIIFMVFLGMVEVGWWVQSWISVATAAREGARYGTRGLHVEASEIAEVVRVVLSSTVDLVLEEPGSNVKIIVTQVDVEPDGSFTIFDTYAVGEMAVYSVVCTSGPCGSNTIDIPSMSASNLAFNENAAFCDEAAGCRADIIVVEVFYDHTLLFPVPFITDYLNENVTINGRGIMRVMIRRDT